MLSCNDHPCHDHSAGLRSAPFVSVVTPVHNTADHLTDCIRSVLAQSYQAWEYVIVNNASTDRSLEIIESFAARDPRIRIVHTDRLLPQVVNYNFALRQISPASRYCKMVQADDWIYPACLEEMVALAETDPEIAIVGAYALANDFVFDHGLVCTGPDNMATVVPGREACRRFLLDRLYVFGSPTSVLYRAELVRSRARFFREVDSGYFEDAELCFDVLENAKFGFIHQILTCTRWNRPSITASVNGFDPRHRLMSYVVTKRYGARYLNESEFRSCVSRAEREYYELLASQGSVGRGSGFWKYHARGLEQAGERIHWSRVRLLQFARLLNFLGNPKTALGTLVRRLFALRWRGNPMNARPTNY
jgi:glycosyltransferase involved in cell wall biosynthesis